MRHIFMHLHPISVQGFPVEIGLSPTGRLGDMNPTQTPVSAARPPLAPHLPQIRLYQDWLQHHRGLAFDNYHALWQWSVTDLHAFWQSIWD